MAVVAGDMREIGVTHETVGNFTLFVKSAEDSNLDKGGYRNTDDANMIDGGGNMIMIKNQVRWSLETLISVDMNTRKDLDKLVALAQSPIEANFTFAYLNGNVQGGTGTIVGDIVSNTNAGTMTVKFAGGGVLKDL
jgi:hypothetical protein